MRTSEQLNELAAALSKAQGAFENAKKDSDNPFFKSKYADLASCIDAARGPLAANGLAVMQAPELLASGLVCMTTRLLHSSGQWTESELAAVPKDSGPQSIGSVITYLRRYALCAMLGLAAEDDDANAGQGVTQEKVTRNARGWAKNDIKPANGQPAPTTAPESQAGGGNSGTANHAARQKPASAGDSGATVSKYSQTAAAIKHFVGTPEMWKVFMKRCCDGVHQLAMDGELTVAETDELKQMLQARVPEFILKESPAEALMAEGKKAKTQTRMDIPAETPF